MTTIFPVYTLSDIEKVVKLACEIWSSHYTPIIGKEQVTYMLKKFQSIPAIAGQIKDGSHYFLLQYQGNDAGYLSYSAKPGHLFLSKLYVASEYRGRGIARAAIEFAGSESMKLGLPKLSLTVNKENKGAITAYKKMGFRQIGPRVQDIGNGYIMDDFLMEKKVG